MAHFYVIKWPPNGSLLGYQTQVLVVYDDGNYDYKFKTQEDQLEMLMRLEHVNWDNPEVADYIRERMDRPPSDQVPLRIPVKSTSDSGSSRPPVLIQVDRRFRSHPASAVALRGRSEVAMAGQR